MTKAEDVLDEVTWFGHSSFMIKDVVNDQNLYYIDPFEFKADRKEKADLIFITHLHFDHCSPDDMRRVMSADTTFVSIPGCVDKMGIAEDRIVHVRPNQEIQVKGIKGRTVHAYNMVKERLSYHPRENDWVGYILNVNGARIYHAGDTDFVDEMKALGKLDVAMLPIGGTYTMAVDEAIDAANAIKAEITVPIHYRRLLGAKSKEAEDRFRSGVKGKVVVMDEISDGPKSRSGKGAM